MSEMSSSEFTEWMAFAELEPFGEWRADLRAGIIASTIANVNRSADSDALTPKDFMPFERTEEEPESDELEVARDQIKRFEYLRLLHGGKHIHRGKVVVN
jgi:hypothetical protein